MDIHDLDKKLQDSINTFAYQAEARPLNYKMSDKLDGTDYDEICRQVFYVFDDFKENIIKYLRELEK